VVAVETANTDHSSRTFPVLGKGLNNEEFVMQGNSQQEAVEEALMVEMAKGGDEAAFGQLWLRHRRRLSYAASRILRNQDDAEDVVQESFLKAYCHIRTFDGRSQFSTWITRIVINTALMSLRKRRRYVDVPINDCIQEHEGYWELADRSPNAESRYLRSECLSHLSAAIHALPTILRNAVEIRLARDGTLRDVAEATGISIPAAKTRLFRAKQRLRMSLDPKLQERSYRLTFRQ
jgi:RNA polymerase sigma-70 factor (ECF subfamily)